MCRLDDINFLMKILCIRFFGFRVNSNNDRCHATCYTIRMICMRYLRLDKRTSGKICVTPTHICVNNRGYIPYAHTQAQHAHTQIEHTQCIQSTH